MKQITVTLTEEQAKLVHKAITWGQYKMMDVHNTDNPSVMKELNELDHIKIDLLWNQLKEAA